MIHEWRLSPFIHSSKGMFSNSGEMFQKFRKFKQVCKSLKVAHTTGDDLSLSPDEPTVKRQLF